MPTEALITIHRNEKTLGKWWCVRINGEQQNGRRNEERDARGSNKTVPRRQSSCSHEIFCILVIFSRFSRNRLWNGKSGGRIPEVLCCIRTQPHHYKLFSYSSENLKMPSAYAWDNDGKNEKSFFIPCSIDDPKITSNCLLMNYRYIYLKLKFICRIMHILWFNKW